MKRSLLAVALLAPILGCAAEGQAPNEVTGPAKDNVEVLFEADGVKVYRFYDSGNPHYFAVDRHGSVTNIESP